MSEKQFTYLMKAESEKNLRSGYSDTSGESLIYKLFVDAEGQGETSRGLKKTL